MPSQGLHTLNCKACRCEQLCDCSLDLDMHAQEFIVVLVEVFGCTGLRQSQVILYCTVTVPETVQLLL